MAKHPTAKVTSGKVTEKNAPGGKRRKEEDLTTEPSGGGGRTYSSSSGMSPVGVDLAHLTVPSSVRAVTTIAILSSESS